MSTYTQDTSGGNNQTSFSYDYRKIFLRNIITAKLNFAASGDDIELAAGQVVGVIGATGKGAIAKSGSTDGSQYPAGVVKEAITIADGDNKDVTIAIAGEVSQDNLVFDGTDTLDTDVSDITMKWRLIGNGIIPRDSDTLVS